MTLYPLNRNIKTTSRKKKMSRANTSFIAVLLFASLVAINDHTNYRNMRRSLCASGNVESLSAFLDEPRGLASSIIAYVDAALNGEPDACEISFPDLGVFEDYPPITYAGGPIPNRPEGTVAFATTIIGCPEWYGPDVEGTPDPGADLFEATAILKNEVCDAVDFQDKLSTGAEGSNENAPTM